MATSKNGGKATKSLFETMKAKGYEVSIAKTPLWQEGETLVEGYENFDFYISTQYVNSAYVVAREGEESKLIPFYRGEIDVEDYETSNAKGLVSKDTYDFTITIKEMEALRDDEELGIKEGEKVLRAFVD